MAAALEPTCIFTRRADASQWHGAICSGQSPERFDGSADCGERRVRDEILDDNDGNNSTRHMICERDTPGLCH